MGVLVIINNNGDKQHQSGLLARQPPWYYRAVHGREKAGAPTHCTGAGVP